MTQSYLYLLPRLNEQNNNVNDNRRLFDSQNNNAAGYQVGDACIPNCLTEGTNTYDKNATGAGEGVMQFYEDSKLHIEWTNQHGSQSPRLHTNFVLQYMCDDELPLRDGKEKTKFDPETEPTDEFGVHESYKYWDECRLRERNNGLFSADQNIKNEAKAIHTRQDRNNNDNRYGFECPEERDYYPYWHPSPWRDIWVCTDTPVVSFIIFNGQQCPSYKAESQNVKEKHFCSIPEFNNDKECRDNFGEWKSKGSWGIEEPRCGICPVTRPNHNGNIDNEDEAPNYMWTIPEGRHIDGAKCVIRIRYNISTADYDGWNTFSGSNDDNSPVSNNPAKDFLGLGTNVTGPLRLAMDTSQFGRTFQDRTHVFQIRKRPSNLNCGIKGGNCHILNVNVRGRRGNIVQTYPAVEYDFVPPNIKASSNIFTDR